MKPALFIAWISLVMTAADPVPNQPAESPRSRVSTVAENRQLPAAATHSGKTRPHHSDMDMTRSAQNDWESPIGQSVKTVSVVDYRMED